MLGKILNTIKNLLVNLLTWRSRKKKADILFTEMEERNYRDRIESKKQQQEIYRQQQEIENLKNVIKDEQGTYEVVNGERKYTIDEDRSRFEEKRHRNLGGIFLMQLKAAGLNTVRTVNGDPKGDLNCPEAGGIEDEAKLEEGIARFKSMIAQAKKVNSKDIKKNA